MSWWCESQFNYQFFLASICSHLKRAWVCRKIITLNSCYFRNREMTSFSRPQHFIRPFNCVHSTSGKTACHFCYNVVATMELRIREELEKNFPIHRFSRNLRHGLNIWIYSKYVYIKYYLMSAYSSCIIYRQVILRLFLYAMMAVETNFFQVSIFRLSLQIFNRFFAYKVFKVKMFWEIKFMKFWVRIQIWSIFKWLQFVGLFFTFRRIF